jgi:hypothetical protein
VVVPALSAGMGVVRSLQVGEGMPLHVGGRFALALQGHEHYLRLGDAGVITLYGPQRPPGWLGKLPLEPRFVFLGKGPLDLPAVPVTAEVSEKALSEAGLAWHSAAPGTDALVCSTPERAMLELCDSVYGCGWGLRGRCADAGHDHAAAAARRPAAALHCRSIKAKRVFLALAERHRHAWLPHVSLEGVDLGRGKRALVPGGRLHPTYQITLPGDLDEHLA